MKKQFIAGLVIGGLAFGTAGVFAGQYMATDNPFPIQLNGVNVSLTGYNINDETYFKLRDIADVVGGFTVGFENNTIQLAKDGYSYQSSTSSNDIVYYSEKPWCPDFGAFTGATLLETQPFDDGSIGYIYDLSTVYQHTKYFDLILATTNLSLNPASTGDFILFENLQTNHTVGIMITTDKFIVIVD